MIQILTDNNWPVLHNFSASAAPTGTDDSNAGYAKGSFWLDTTANIIYQCIDASVGSAVWLQLSTSNTPAGIVSGTYTGDGTTSQAITGLGGTPKYLRIWEQKTTDTSALFIFETTTEIIGDIAGGGSIRKSDSDAFRFKDNRVVSLDSDGFTVGDDSIDAHPNKNGRVYNYLGLLT